MNEAPAAPRPTSETAAPGPTTPVLVLALPGIVLTLVLALWGLDHRSLWLDESFSLGATNQLRETIDGTGGTMVGYYLALSAWVRVSDSVWWLRLFSALAMAAAVIPLCAIGRRLGGPTVARRAGLLLAASYPVTRYAQEARSYALVALLATTAWWCVLRAVLAEDDDRARRHLLPLAVLAPAALLCHGLAVLHLVAQAVAIAVSPAPRRLRGLAPAAIGTGAVLVVLYGLGVSEVGNWIPPLSLEQVADVLGTYTSPVVPAAVALAVLLAVGLVVADRTRGAGPEERWLRRVPVLWVAVPAVALLAISVLRPYLIDRYLIGIAPGLALLGARATAALDARLPGPLRRLPLAGAAALALLVPGQIDLHRSEGDDWRTAARVVAASAAPGDAVLFPFSDHRVPFEAAWREVPATAHRPDLVQTQRPLGLVRRHDSPVDPPEEAARLRAAQRVWVVSRVEVSVPPEQVRARLDALAATEGLAPTRVEQVDPELTVWLLERPAR